MNTIIKDCPFSTICLQTDRMHMDTAILYLAIRDSKFWSGNIQFQQKKFQRARKKLQVGTTK